MTSWRRSPDGKILKDDVSVAKNYLFMNELDRLNRIVTMYLDHAEFQAQKNIPMTMQDWAIRLDKFLDFNDMNVLNSKGKISAKVAKEFAESEWEKYRILQDRIYKSDFDKFIIEMKMINK